MVRIYIAITVLFVGSASAQTQRVVGCTPGVASAEVLDHNLRAAGYSTTRESAGTALRDPGSEVRSLAALKNDVGAQGADVAPLLEAWIGEADGCAKSQMGLALSATLDRLARQQRGGQARVTPFQSCTPSRPGIISLTIETVNNRSWSFPTVRISARNLTPQTLAFIQTASPAELFSLVVSGPTGEHAKVTNGHESLYQPPGPPPDPKAAGTVILPGGSTSMPIFQALRPNEEISWNWWAGGDFDMSAPGVYRVSIGGRLDYLNTTVCSNAIDITVGK